MNRSSDGLLTDHECPRTNIRANFRAKIEAIVFLILILKLVSKNVFEQLAVSCVGCFHLSVLWYDFINKQIFSFFCNNHVQNALNGAIMTK